MRPKHNCQQYQHNSASASMYINTRCTRHNSQRWTPIGAQGIYHTRLAEQKRGCGTRHTQFWPIRYKLNMIDTMAIKGK